jgi:hypothetical protein
MVVSTYVCKYCEVSGQTCVHTFGCVTFLVAPRSYVACGFPHNRVYPHRINVQIVTKAIEPSWDTRECRSVRCKPCYVLSHL